MPWLAELALFLTPFALFALWRRLNPGHEPGVPLLLAAALGVALLLGSVAWFGLGRSLEAGRYVAPHFEAGRLVPGHTEPLR